PGVFHVDLRSMHAHDVTIQVHRNSVEVVDNRSGRVIGSQNLDEVERLVVVGSNNRSNSITLGRIPSGVLSEGIEIQAGDSPGDFLEIQGTNGRDSISIGSDGVTINGVVVQISGIDRIRVQAQRGDDVQIADDIDIPVIVDRGRDPHSHATPPHLQNVMDSVFSSGTLMDGLLQAPKRRPRR
ncbi:MAG: hypothetical protein KDA84_01375, partial [Planctomycetaceae bacterium]|nr:hypothetical protein [Planctomycetaceae bacterium]